MTKKDKSELLCGSYYLINFLRDESYENGNYLKIWSNNPDLKDLISKLETESHLSNGNICKKCVDYSVCASGSNLGGQN